MFDARRFITQRAQSIDASGIRKVFELAEKIDNPINLSIGQPDFDVPEPIRHAAIDAIEGGRNSYTMTQGIAELRTRIESEFNTRFRHAGRWDSYGTLITAGVSAGLALAMLVCIEAEQEVLVPDPYFVMYKHLTKMAGGRPVFVDTYPDFQISAERVEPLITDRTKMLVVSSPSNPTGVITSESAWRDLVDLCERRGILIVSDEIYDVFCHDPVDTPLGPRCASPASLSDNMLVLRGYSKTYGMTGWRLGYAVGPRSIIEQMTKLQQYTFVCAPSIVQHAALAAMDVDMSAYVAAYRRKRDRVVEALSPQFELTLPQGAFYAFPKVPTGETGTQFVQRAIARELLIIPGGVFSERDTHFRISYACDDAMLDRGLEILLELAATARV